MRALVCERFPRVHHSEQRAKIRAPQLQMGRSTGHSLIHESPIHCDLVALAAQAILTPARYPYPTSTTNATSTPRRTHHSEPDIPTNASVPTTQSASPRPAEKLLAAQQKNAVDVEQEHVAFSKHQEFGNFVSPRELPVCAARTACRGFGIREGSTELVPDVETTECHVKWQVGAQSEDAPAKRVVPSGLAASEVRFERSVGDVCDGTVCAPGDLLARIVPRELVWRRMSEMKEFGCNVEGLDDARDRDDVRGGESDGECVVLDAGVCKPCSSTCEGEAGKQGCGALGGCQGDGVEETVMHGEEERSRRGGEQGVTRNGKKRRVLCSNVSGAQFDKLISTGHIDKHLCKEERRLLRYWKDPSVIRKRRSKSKAVIPNFCDGKQM